MRASLILALFLAPATSFSSVVSQAEHDRVVSAMQRTIQIEKAKNLALQQNCGIEHKETDSLGEELGPAVPNTNNKIWVVRSHYKGVCDKFTSSSLPLLGHGNCQPAVPKSPKCTQSADTPAGYWDYTDNAAELACGSPNWNNAIRLYTQYQLWDISVGHSAIFSVKGRITGWDGRDGDFMVISIIGHARGSSVQCTLEAGVKMMLCNQHAANWACTCRHNGKAGPFVLLEQGAKLASGTQGACGNWFISASTSFNMLVGNMRANAARFNPVVERCVAGRTDPKAVVKKAGKAAKKAKKRIRARKACACPAPSKAKIKRQAKRLIRRKARKVKIGKKKPGARRSKRRKAKKAAGKKTTARKKFRAKSKAALKKAKLRAKARLQRNKQTARDKRTKNKQLPKLKRRKANAKLARKIARRNGKVYRRQMSRMSKVIKKTFGVIKKSPRRRSPAARRRAKTSF